MLSAAPLEIALFWLTLNSDTRNVSRTLPIHTSEALIMKAMNIVVFGLSITSSWGNGHATTYRSLLKALAARGHKVTFFEKDVPWYAAHRDMTKPSFCRTVLYRDTDELEDYTTVLAQADLIIMGSYVQHSGELTDRITTIAPPCFAFYDIDTPVTLAKLAKGDFGYLHPSMIPRFDLYLSFTGGPILRKLEADYGAQCARPLYCSVDPDLYYPVNPADTSSKTYELGYLGTYSEDRQGTVNELLVAPAKVQYERLFCVAGAQYPKSLNWPDNMDVSEHVPPDEHRHFYNAQRFTLNVTRRDMINTGYSPSVRLFEAAACGTPIISDYWRGLECFFDMDREILVAQNRNQVLKHLALAEEERMDLGRRLREKVMKTHTSTHRAQELEQHWQEVAGSREIRPYCGGCTATKNRPTKSEPTPGQDRVHACLSAP